MRKEEKRREGLQEVRRRERKKKRERRGRENKREMFVVFLRILVF
jgi:hypothetical protein